jgi:hypothetical protein
MKKTAISILQEIITGRKYFSVNAIKATANARERTINPATINQYLYNLKTQQKNLYGAGRGWYSTIATEYKLLTDPIEELNQQIHRKFPLLSFSLWTTKQLQPFAHHLMMQFVTFVFTEFDAMQATSEFLKDQGLRSFLNPQKLEIEKYFDASIHSVVVRPMITREPVDKHYATIEKILIDLFIEKGRLLLMDGAEYRRIFHNLVISSRINMARLLEYAERRKVEESFIATIIKPERDFILFEGPRSR